MASAPLRCSERFASVFIFRLKTFFFNNSIFEFSTDDAELSMALKWCLERLLAILLFGLKIFSSTSFSNLMRCINTCTLLYTRIP